MAQATVMKIVGPAVIAVTLNALLYGICLDQFIQYQICERQDSMWIKLLVYWMFTSDTTHTVSTVYMLWYYVVDNFGNVDILTTVPWPYLLTSIFIVCTSCPIQHLLALHIAWLSRSGIAFCVLSALSLISTALGLANAVIGFLKAKFVFHTVIFRS
ncbi:hypothetical protein AcV7_004126 [Taiwanofungus camphoratus]|nr:hypothetical protein AcV7_004126 [Antrodia cinnamomea]